MHPKGIEIEGLQARIRPEHELDKDVLFWIDEVLPHAVRYLGLPLHRDIEDCLRIYAKGLWWLDINHIEDGVARLADFHDEALLNQTFRDRIG